jgi:hypothetical protein
MKLVRRLIAMLACLLLAAGISSTAFAVDDLCTIRIFSGAQGTVPGGTVSTYQIKRGEPFDKISVIGGYASVAAGSKYYAKGLRESGKEESHELSFKVEKDEDFVVTYGIKGEQVEYFVRYVDASGADLADPNGPFYANVGDRVYVAYLEISGYQPDAYNKVRTLTDDYTFEFVYTRVPTGGGGGGTGGGGGGGGGAAVAGGAAANGNAANNAANNQNPNNQNPNNQNPNNPDNGTQPAAPAAPLELIDEDAVPLAVPSIPGVGTVTVPNAPQVIEPNQHGRIPNWMLIAGLVILVGLISVLYWYLLFYRKKKKYASFNEDYDILDFDKDDDF